MKKVIFGLAGSTGVLLMTASKAFAASIFEVPTSTVSDFTASVSDTLSDPGLLTILVAAIAIPLVFYIAKKLIGLIPKGR